MERRRPAASGTDLEWYYEVANAYAVLGLAHDYGPNFTRDSCGRLADVLDAATAAAQSWFEEDLTGSGLRHALRAHTLGDDEAIRPAVLQELFGWSFEDAVAVLTNAERRGLLVRSGKGYRFGPPLCSSCYTERAAMVETGPFMSTGIAPPRDPIPAQLRFRVLQRDGFRCQYCGRSARDGATLHLDHIVPFAAGGATHESNLITACEACNLGKAMNSVV
jgi:hypothetical protein